MPNKIKSNPLTEKFKNIHTGPCNLVSLEVSLKGTSAWGRIQAYHIKQTNTDEEKDGASKCTGQRGTNGKREKDDLQTHYEKPK